MSGNLDPQTMAEITTARGKPDFVECNEREEVRECFLKQPALDCESVSVAVRQPHALQQSGGNFVNIFQAEQARLLYDVLPAALITDALLALILASVLWPVAEAGQLFGWLAMLAAILLARITLAVGRHRAVANGVGHTELRAPIWLRRFRVTSAATGLVWGAGAVLLFPSGDAPHQVFLAFVMAGASVGAITVLAVDRVSVLGFLVPIQLPLAVEFDMNGGLVSQAIDAMIVLYLVFIIVGSSRVARSFHENVRLRIEADEREQVLRLRNQELASVVESSPDNIIRYDPDCRAVYVNRRMEKTLNVAAASLVGKTPTESKFDGLLGIENYQAKLQRVIVTGERDSVEVTVPDSDGNLRTHHVHLVAERGGDGEIIGALAFGRDVTQHKEADEQIRHLAFYDALTQLPNRRLLHDRLQHSLSANLRSEKRGALLLIDLDNFKTLNDTLGHDKGDRLLQQVAQRLLSSVRKGDTVARLGNDEFVVILENLSELPREAAALAESLCRKIFAALNQDYLLDGYECHSTQSIGITLFGGLPQSMDELLRQAVLAMYRAKESGRNNLRFFDPDMQDVVTTRAALEVDVRGAMQKNQILLHYQPQVNQHGCMTGAEALVRWQHPERGVVMPGDFISLAEETGLILPIGLWVLETACAQLAAWSARAETAHLTLSVNVSARQMLHPNFVEQVLAALDASGANPKQLKLELTESLLLDNVGDTIDKMIALKSVGIGFSLDDFGTGYSSLTYLKRLPLDQLKIDQSFVRDVLIDANDAAIARTIITLAHSLGLNVIAEGVESAEQRDLLAHYGCNTYQGYLYSRPLPADQIEAFVLGEGRC